MKVCEECQERFGYYLEEDRIWRLVRCGGGFGGGGGLQGYSIKMYTRNVLYSIPFTPPPSPFMTALTRIKVTNKGKEIKKNDSTSKKYWVEALWC
jgi:hypothetical protein